MYLYPAQLKFLPWAMLRDFQPVMITKFDFNAAIELTSLIQLFCTTFSMQDVYEASFSNSSFYVPKFQSYYLCFATTLLLFWGHCVRLFEVSLILCLVLLLISPFLGQSRSHCALLKILVVCEFYRNKFMSSTQDLDYLEGS